MAGNSLVDDAAEDEGSEGSEDQQQAASAQAGQRPSNGADEVGSVTNSISCALQSCKPVHRLAGLQSGPAAGCSETAAPQEDVDSSEEEDAEGPDEYDLTDKFLAGEGDEDDEEREGDNAEQAEAKRKRRARKRSRDGEELDEEDWQLLQEAVRTCGRLLCTSGRLAARCSALQRGSWHGCSPEPSAPAGCKGHPTQQGSAQAHPQGPRAGWAGR